MIRRVAALAAALTLTCSESPTQIIVRLFPDRSSATVSQVTLSVRREGDPPGINRSYNLADYAPPLELGLIASDLTDARRVLVTASASTADGQHFITVYFDVAFTRGESTVLDVPLAFRCIDAVSTCGADQNCTFSGCAPRRVEALPIYDRSAPVPAASCPLVCGGNCLDGLRDRFHCGQCNVACAGTQRCIDGACLCGASEITCGADCFDREDPAHCGGCARACLVACRHDACVQATSVSVGQVHACAAMSDGSATCWGIATGALTGAPGPFRAAAPVVMPDAEGAVAKVSVGALHSCALRSQTVVCWGSNDNGELGRASLVAGFQPPGRVAMDDPFDDVSAGTGFTCALTVGEVRCWGANDHGQTGQTPSALPARGTVAGLGPARAVVTGAAHACALLASGEVWCWGSNGHGQCGATQSTAEAPRRVALASAATALAAGGDHTCAVADGVLWCWGDNSTGALGDGTTLDHPTPVTPDALAAMRIRSVALGEGHTCALVSAADDVGRVYCWGNNMNGQLGVGALSGRVVATTPLLVPTLSPPLPGALAAGARATCLLEHDGRVFCWGDGLTPSPAGGASQYSPYPVVW